jgi:hypothetical protein
MCCSDAEIPRWVEEVGGTGPNLFYRLLVSICDGFCKQTVVLRGKKWCAVFSSRVVINGLYFLLHCLSGHESK